MHNCYDKLRCSQAIPDGDASDSSLQERSNAFCGAFNRIELGPTRSPRRAPAHNSPTSSRIQKKPLQPPGSGDGHHHASTVSTVDRLDKCSTTRANCSALLLVTDSILLNRTRPSPPKCLVVPIHIVPLGNPRCDAATYLVCQRLGAARHDRNTGPLAEHLLHKDRKSTRLNSSHSGESRMPSSA